MVKLPANFSLYTKVPRIQLSQTKLMPIEALLSANKKHGSEDNMKLETKPSLKPSLVSLPLIESAKILSPQDSIQEAINNAKPGDVLHLKSGVYDLGNLYIQKKQNLTIVGELGTKIMGNLQVSHSHDISIEHIHIEGQNIRSIKKSQPTEMNIPEMFVADSSNVTLENMTFSHLKGHGKTGNNARSMLEINPTSQSITVKNNRFFSGDKDFNATPQNKYLMVNGLRTLGKNTHIEGNSFNNVGIGIQSGGIGTTIISNQINNFSQDGIQVYGDKTRIISNTISNLLYLDAPENSDKVAHHDAIQLWSPEPENDQGGRYKGKYALKDVSIEGNIIKSTTDANRPFQGVLQGIAAFDGYMDGLSIQHNQIYTHSTKHGITINAPRSSETRSSEISHNTIENQYVSKPLGDLKPTLNLNVLRFKNDPSSKTETWTWRKNDDYSVKMQNNTLSTPASIQTQIKVSL